MIGGPGVFTVVFRVNLHNSIILALYYPCCCFRGVLFTPRSQELERAASMGEVDVAKLRGEREAAALSRAALMEELDRAKSSTSK